MTHSVTPTAILGDRIDKVNLNSTVNSYLIRRRRRQLEKIYS